MRQEEIANVTSSLDKIMAAMATLSANSPLMGEYCPSLVVVPCVA